MISVLASILTTWNRRYARADPAALHAVRGRVPATIVTGGSKGIGKSLARVFAANGDTVVLVARGREALAAAAREIRRQSDVVVLVCPLDVTAPDALERLDAFLEANGLYPGILINNAGVGAGGPFCDEAPERVDEIVSLNMASATRLMRHALPGMRARAEGGVLNVASAGGYAPGPYQAAYYASKAYILSLTEAVASEMAGRGVRVCALAPGPVETPFHEAMGTDDAFYRRLIPALSPDAVARAGWRGFRLWRRVIVPGLIPSGLVLAVRVLPHFLTVPFIGWLLAPRRRVKKDTQ